MREEVADYDLELATPPEVVLDIGACVGAYTARCIQRWPGVKVHAYEPVRDSADAFRTLCGDFKNVSFTQAAVRRFNGQDLIKLGKHRQVCGFHELGRQLEPGYYVDCISSANLPEADLIKIDTEGCEVEILEKLNTDRTRAIVCEWHTPEDRVRIIELCLHRGFLLHAEAKNKTPEERGFIPEKPAEFEGGILKFVKPGAVSKIKLFIGVPVYQQVPTQFMNCMFALQAQKPFPLQVSIGQGDGVMRTRNVLTAEFLKSDCTHMLQIDCDLIFSWQHVARIASHDVDVVGGFYPKKQEGPLEWVINTYPGPTRDRDDFLKRVSYIGTGFMCVRRSVFERMLHAYPWITYGADYGARDQQQEIWPVGTYCYECRGAAGPACTHSPKSRRYLSEDWWFCQRWMDMGGEVFGDTKIVLKHIGPVIYPLQTQMGEITNPKVADTISVSSSDTAIQT